MGTQDSQALAEQGSSPLERRTVRAHHCGKHEGADKNVTLFMPLPEHLFLRWETGSRDRHRVPDLNDEAQPRGGCQAKLQGAGIPQGKF